MFSRLRAAVASLEVLAAYQVARTRRYTAKAALEVEDTPPGRPFVIRWR